MSYRLQSHSGKLDITPGNTSLEIISIKTLLNYQLKIFVNSLHVFVPDKTVCKSYTVSACKNWKYLNMTCITEISEWKSYTFSRTAEILNLNGAFS